MKRTVALMCVCVMIPCFALAGQAGTATKPSTRVRLNPQSAALGDGEAVRLKTNAPVPLGRGYCARMPYDPVGKVGLVYGACHNPGAIAQNDVWRFDAATATWTELVKSDPRRPPLRYTEFGVLVPKDGPDRPPGVGHTYNVICFDISAGRMVSLRGGTPRWLGLWSGKRFDAKREALKVEARKAGVDPAKARRCLPWLFDVTTRTWSLACPTGDVPNHTRAEACVYDPKHEVVLYWKTDPDVNNHRGGVYAYDAAKNHWTFKKTKGGPAVGIEQLACWDPVNERVLYFSGSYSGTTRRVKCFDYATLTWTTLEATDWPKRETPHPKRGPLLEFCSGGGSLAFDTASGKAILVRAGTGRFTVYPYDVRTNTFEPPKAFEGYRGGHLKTYYDPDQNAVIINGGADLRRSETWAYRYRRAAE